MSPELLPSIASTRRVAQSLAMLDAILCPEWEYRYYSFNSRWGPDQEMGSMRNGSGDDWFLLLDAAGVALKGFAHELASDEGLASEVQRQVPASFGSFLNEPAFSMENVTFCYWREVSDDAWSKVRGAMTDDGSDEMLARLVEGPEGYQEWAEEYFEVPVDLAAVRAIFAHEPITRSIVAALNPESDLSQVRTDAVEIGFPHDAL